MDMDRLLEALEECEAQVLEPREVFDCALIGIARRACGMTVAAYDTEKCIAALMAENSWDYDEAAEWFEANTAGAYVGDGTPVFVDLMVPA